MSLALKPIEEQVIVITGATSGIGLTTARMAADRGARVVLVARSERELEAVATDIRESGGHAEYVVADVSDRDAVREVAERARTVYGGLDTWVNCAGVFLYGTLEDTPIEEMREQFDVNVWGLLYGSLAAADAMRERAEGAVDEEQPTDGEQVGDEERAADGQAEPERAPGGAIVNIGSIVSDRAFPLQGSYSASKHAVKGFTDALRMELEKEGAPISVTLVKPSAIDTPYPEHAKNYMNEEAQLPPPVYAPETVAETILHAAEHPTREVTVGGGGKLATTLARYAPGLMDTIMEKLFFRLQRRDEPARPRHRNTLDEPAGEARARGGHEGRVRERSVYTAAQRRSNAAVIAGGIAVAATLLYGVLRTVRSNSGVDVTREETGPAGGERSGRVRRKTN